MKRGLPVLIVCTLLALAVGPTLGADADKDKEKLQGTWKSISFEGVGIEKNAKSVTLEFKGDYVESTIGLDRFRLALDLDVGAIPRQMDLTQMVGKARLDEQTNKGIYVLEDDVLTICLGGILRPKRFELRPDTSDVLIKLKRQRK